MASPSLTYILNNGTLADASQIMQNYNDIINALTDSTKDLAVNALTTTAGLTVGGNTALGDSSTDTITVTATPTISSAVTISNSTAATTTSTGALIVTGGVGIGGALYAGGATRLTAGTASTTSSTGTLVVTGGTGISGAINIGTVAAVGGAIDAAVGLYVKNAALSGTSQYGMISAVTGTSAATARLRGFESNATTANSAFTCPVRTHFWSGNTTKGAASTITRDVAFGGDVPTQGGTGNAFIADSESFTAGDWFLIGASSNASRLSGRLDMFNQSEVRFYEGSSGANYVGLKAPASLAADQVWTLPTADGAANFALSTDGSGATSFAPITEPASVINASIACSVGSSALTIALKDSGGSDPSSTSPAKISFRSATAATGTYTVRSVTSALSTVISSGSTAGHASALAENLYVYAIDNAGTVELAWSTSLFDEGSRQSTTAEGGAGAADSRVVMYSTTARTNVAVRLLARLSSTQTTAGTWDAVPTEISLRTNRPQHTRSQVTYDTHAGYGSGATMIPYYTNERVNTGSAIEIVTNDATDGLKLRIKEDGLYAVSACISSATSGIGEIGISKNSSQLTTAVDAITVSDRLDFSYGTAASGDIFVAKTSWVGRLVPGDLIRPHGGAQVPGSAARSHFSIAKIAD